MFDAEKLCTDYNIPFDVTGKNTAPGWIQVQCPFCGDTGNHLGINKIKGYANCWKCGHHFLDRTLSEILGLNIKACKELISEYETSARYHLQEKQKSKAVKTKMPYGTTKLQERHKQYLIKRNFDPVILEKKFNLQGTSNLGNYKFRIIAPIYYNQILISYQGRDITNKAPLRYKACPINEEVLHHKYSLYNIDAAKSFSKSVIVVEGIFDVFRLIHGTVSPFGTSWTKEQMLMLNKYFDHIYLLFDIGDEAQEKAEKLCWELSALGKETILLTGLFSDPGDMSQKEANELIKDIFKKETNNATFTNFM